MKKEKNNYASTMHYFLHNVIRYKIGLYNSIIHGKWKYKCLLILISSMKYYIISAFKFFHLNIFIKIFYVLVYYRNVYFIYILNFIKYI